MTSLLMCRNEKCGAKILSKDAMFCSKCGASLHSKNDKDFLFKGLILNEKYRLIEEIAEGGMAYVYKAQHEFLDDFCAVKIIKSSLAEQDEMLERFKREARLTRQVARRNPYVISIYDFGAEKNIGFYYVMELLQGMPFSDFLEGPLTLPEPQKTVRWVCQICEALAIVHEEGLVHRDIKPDNIFLHNDPNQGDEIVKLLDFGIARPTYSETKKLTSYGRVMGTPEYMSPEQCRGPTPEQYEKGESHLDGRSDIYSLGVLLYQLLTGAVPFPLRSASGHIAIHKVMAGHVMEEPTPLNQKRPDLTFPSLLEKATLRALAKRPEDRFQTMREFRDELLHSYPSLRSQFRSLSKNTEPSSYGVLCDADTDVAEESLSIIEKPSLEKISMNETAVGVSLPLDFLDQAKKSIEIDIESKEVIADEHSIWDSEEIESRSHYEECSTNELAKTLVTSFPSEVIEELRQSAKKILSQQSSDEIDTNADHWNNSISNDDFVLEKKKTSASKKMWYMMSFLFILFCSAILFILFFV